jgi:hypothetical protein
MALLSLACRVKDLHSWYADPAAQLRCHPSRHPEIAVYQVVARAITQHKAQQRLQERRHQRPEVILRHECRRPNRQIDHPHAWCPGHHLGCRATITASEHIHRISKAAKLAA